MTLLFKVNSRATLEATAASASYYRGAPASFCPRLTAHAVRQRDGAQPQQP